MRRISKFSNILEVSLDLNIIVFKRNGQLFTLNLETLDENFLHMTDQYEYVIWLSNDFLLIGIQNLFTVFCVKDGTKVSRIKGIYPISNKFNFQS